VPSVEKKQNNRNLEELLEKEIKNENIENLKSILNNPKYKNIIFKIINKEDKNKDYLLLKTILKIILK
jgi:cellulase/cellobiase CelA1